MFYENIVMLGDVYGIFDSFLSMEDLFNFINWDFVLFFDNINNNMGKMVGFLVKLCEKLVFDECL